MSAPHAVRARGTLIAARVPTYRVNLPRTETGGALNQERAGGRGWGKGIPREGVGGGVGRLAPSDMICAATTHPTSHSAACGME